MNVRKLWKAALITGSLTLGMSVFADHHQGSVTADGKVYYKLPTTQEIVKRDVQLVVPAKGEGDVILVTKNSALKADDFFSKEHNGRILFYVIFKNPPHSPANTLKVFRGTYLRGSNMAVYDGEIFTRTYSSDRMLSFISSKDIFEMKNLDKVPSKFTYQAGFIFKAMIPTQGQGALEGNLLFDLE